MRPQLPLALLVAALLSPAAVLWDIGDAQAQNAAERRSDHRQIADDHRDRGDDVVDLAQLVQIVDHWHDARNAGDAAAEQSADARITAWLRRELAEDRREVRETQAEVAASRAEVSSSNAERNTTSRRRAANVRRGRPVRAAANTAALRDDRRDLQDDRRDLADDRQDAAVAQLDRARTRAIAQELSDLQPVFSAGSASPGQAARKSELLRELQVMGRQEIRRGTVEIREDNAELREDRGETREDARRRR